MMRVAISMLTLVPGVNGGTETATRALARELARDAGGLEVHALLPKIAADAHEGLPHTVVAAYRSSRRTVGRLRAMSAAAVAPGRVRRQMLACEPDLVHFPFTLMLPTLPGVPCVTTIHDVQHRIYPGFYSPVMRRYLDGALARAVRHSHLVITSSHYSRRTITDLLGVSADRVKVVYLGADLSLFHPGSQSREPFLLYPAHRHPHKNHTRLFQALALLRRRRPGLRLVLTGHGHEGYPVPEGVEVRGRLPFSELADLYRRASCVVFPSLNEGFGQPVVEAMASGCPVAAARMTALPEVCGDAARLFNPYQPQEIAAAVEEVLDEPEPWIERGLRRAPQFTWRRCADAHLEIYREALAL